MACACRAKVCHALQRHVPNSCMSVRVGVLFRGRLPYTIFNSSYMSEDPAAPWEFDMAKPPGRTYKCDRSTLAS